jgi:hypothetical protein
MALPNPALVGRNGRIWRDYCRGATQEKLAEKYELTQQRISQIVNEVKDSIAIEERADLVKRETDLLLTLREEVLDLWDADAPDLVSNGRVIEGTKDHSGRLAALAAVDRLTARLHRVHGLDAPAKLDLNLHGEEEKAKQAGAEALTFLHGGTDADS